MSNRHIGVNAYGGKKLTQMKQSVFLRVEERESEIDFQNQIEQLGKLNLTLD